jgi:hypothetical protein
MPPAPRPVPARPATDPVVAIAGNATMLGIGYMFMRRPILAAVALTGTGFLLWSAAVQTENPLWRFLLPAWGLVMILHAWWLTRRARPERLVDLVEPDPARRGRVYALTAAAVVLMTVVWYRVDALWIANEAETAHAAGDCERATGELAKFDAVHRVAAGPITLRGEEERDACELLLTALDEPPAEAAHTIEEYIAHPGALWDGAGPKRAEFMFDSAMAADDPRLTTVEDAFAQLSATLEDLPGQSAAVRSTVEAFMADLEEVSPCKGYQVDDWLSRQTWDEPELTEPIAAVADQVPVRMLACAQDRVATGESEEAGILFREFLTAYPDHGLAVEAANAVLDSGTYCANPVAYQGAPEYGGGGPYPMRLLGGWSPEGRGFPASWLGETADETALVVCVEAEVGEFQESCQYRRPDGSTFWASFFAHRFSIEAYSLRTGERVEEYAREIGDPCPNRIDGTYQTIYFSSSENFLTLASEYSNEDFRNLFAPLMD